MSSEVATMGMDKAIMVTPEQVTVIKNTVAVGATDDELKLFIYDCQRRGVHPLDKMIHFIKRGTGDKAKASHQAGIDFMRALAEESGEYRGQKGPFFENKVNGDLESATVTVVRKMDNDLVEFTATAFWDEYYPGDTMGFMWKKMPRVMLGKVAEVAALRKAFPRKLNGLYTPEEMAQADRQTKTSAPVSRPAPPKPAAPVNQQIEDALINSEEADMPLAEKIDLALDHLAGGEEAAKKNLLIEASRGGKAAGALLVYSKLHDPSTNQGWLKRIYGYLEGKIQESQTDSVPEFGE